MTLLTENDRKLPDFLSFFNEATEAPTAAPTQEPTAPVSPRVDFNDPQIVAALNKARAEERDQRIKEAEKLKQEKKEAQEQLAAMKAAQEKIAEEKRRAELESMKPGDRKVEEIKDDITKLREQLEASQKQAAEASRQANAWRIEAEKENIIAKHGGNINPLLLDTSSVEALKASENTAVQDYHATERFFYNKFQKQHQENLESGRQEMVNTLPGYPTAQGLPTPNRAGGVASADEAPLQNQMSSVTHPQLDGGQSFAEVRKSVLGRVQAVVPPAQGNMFPANYVQPQPPSPVVQPQGLPTPAPTHPQMAQGTPPGNQAQAPAQSGDETPLTPQQVVAAREQAQAIIASKRASGNASIGTQHVAVHPVQGAPHATHPQLRNTPSPQ